MRLLVSVRSATEVAAAVSGGATIVDAKEPARGPLGPVDASTLRAITAALPVEMPLSIALGDLQNPGAVAGALSLLGPIARRPRALYVKIGLAGVQEATAARLILAAAVKAAARAPLRPEVVAVAYADHEAARALPRQTVSRLAADVGARGVLLDTWTKDGRDVFASVEPTDLQRWLEHAAERGLLTALAGSLSLDAVRRAVRLPVDVLGVRGAACVGGRAGTVDEGRVRALATLLIAADLRTAAV
jgi:(5-formylfuran-3-yl)methyl phosphate synthase